MSRLIYFSNFGESQAVNILVTFSLNHVFYLVDIRIKGEVGAVKLAPVKYFY